MADSTPLAVPFALQPDEQTAADTVIAKAKDAQDYLPKFLETMGTVNFGKAYNTWQNTKEKEALTNEVVKATDDYHNTIQPVYQKSEQINDRLVELDHMNPIKKAIFGLFNSNYNPDDLRAMDQNLKGDIQAHSVAYVNNMGVMSNKAEAIDNAYKARMGLLDVYGNNTQATLALKNVGVQTAKEVYNSITEKIAGDAADTAAQIQQVGKTLSGLTINQIQDGIALGKKNGGIAIIDGVKIPVGELIHQQNKVENERLEIQQLKLNNQLRQGELADHNMQNIISGMSEADLSAARDAGGLYKGVRLNLDMLGRSLAERTQVNTIAAQNSVANLQGPIVAQQIKDIADYQDVFKAKVSGVFGYIPPELNAAITSQNAKLAAFHVGYVNAAAKSPGELAKYLQASQPLIKEAQEDVRKQAESLGAKYAGGNADVGLMMSNYFQNIPSNPSITAKGMIALAHSGLPTGMKMPAELQGMFTATQKKVLELEPSRTAGMIPRTPEQLKMHNDAVEAAVQEVVKQGYANHALNQFQYNLPEYAKNAKDEKGNDLQLRFGGINPTIYHEGQVHSQQNALGVVARELNTTTDKVAQMLTEGPTGKVAVDLKKANPKFDFDTSQQHFNSAEHINMLQFLKTDTRLPPLPGTMTWADAYNQALTHPTVQNNAATSIQAESSKSIVGYMGSQIGATQVDSSIRQLGNQTANSHAILNAADRDTQRRAANDTLRNPAAYLRATVSHMDGITTSQRDRFVEEVFKGIQLEHPQFGDAPTIFEGAPFKLTDDVVDSYIHDHVFDNKELEQVRKKAAAQLPKSREKTKGILESQMDYPGSPGARSRENGPDLTSWMGVQ